MSPWLPRNQVNPDSLDPSHAVVAAGLKIFLGDEWQLACSLVSPLLLFFPHPLPFHSFFSCLFCSSLSLKYVVSLSLLFYRLYHCSLSAHTLNLWSEPSIGQLKTETWTQNCFPTLAGWTYVSIGWMSQLGKLDLDPYLRTCPPYLF